MQTYAEFRPTGFDPKGLNADTHGIGAFLVMPCGQNRDSSALERSNFRSALKALGDESDSVQVHRFGHWACGWFEVILVDPSDAAALQTATEIADALEGYPVVSDDDFSELEYEEAIDRWAHMSVRERVDMIGGANDRSEPQIPVFAARRDYLPEDPAGRLFEALTRE